jgi:phosphate transport system protein
MVRLRFQQSLNDLKERLLVMAGMAEQAIQRAVEAYRTNDISICDLVDHGEQAIDRFEREIDQMALDLLAMEQPMAIDLRFILAVIKINADLERVGDAASSISDRVRDLQAFPVRRSAGRYSAHGLAGSGHGQEGIARLHRGRRGACAVGARDG